MIFTDPIDFDAAIKILREKNIVVTDLPSWRISQLRDQFNIRGMFSAKTLNAQLLQGYMDQLKDAGSQSNLATMRTAIKKLIDELEIAPPSEKEAGSITDLGSNSRIGLVLRTNLDMARGKGQYDEGMTAGARQAFPALELVRVEDRMVPREWFEIWDDAREDLGEDTTATSAEETGRMVAKKGDPIWLAISDFGQPWPPFKYNSGMGLEDVDWQDAVELEVIDEDEDAPEGEEFDFNEGVESSIAELAPEIITVLEEGLQGIAKVVGGAVQMISSKPKPATAANVRNRCDEALELMELSS